MRLGAVVAAAGLSRRMGLEKVLLPFGRSTILQTVLETLDTAGVETIAAVLRSDLPEAAERASQAGACVVVNPAPHEEMLSSIRLGIEALPDDVDAIFVWPADHPLVLPDTIRALAARGDRARALIPLDRRHRGHPALLGRDLAREAGRADLRGGLRDLWRLRADAVDELETGDPGVVFNVDTPEQYAQALRLMRERTQDLGRRT